MTNVPPPGTEMAAIDLELSRLDWRRGQLLARRAHLVALLAQSGPEPEGPRWGAGTPRARAVAPPREVAPRGAQNVLLSLGGALLALAAIAFTVVSWGRLGEGGRTVVLTLLTLAALVAPVPLLARKLTATAETVAALGLVLTVLDAFGVYAISSPSSGAGFAAGAAAVLTALWAALGGLVGGLRLPLPAAVLAGQFPLVCWALAAGAAPVVVAWALLATGALDAGVALVVARRTVRQVAAVAACGVGGWGLFAGWWFSVSADSPLGAVGPGVLLLAGAGVCLLVAWRERAWSVPCSLAAGLCWIAAAGDVVRPSVPGDWAAAGYLICGVVLLTAVRAALPRGIVRGLAAAAGASVSGCAVWALPTAAVALLGSVHGAAGVWAGAPGGAREAMGVDGGAPTIAAAPLVLAGAAAALLCGHLWLARALWPQAPEDTASARRSVAQSGSLVLGWAAVLALPPAADLGYVPTLVLFLALVAATLALAGRPPSAVGGPAVVTALCCALACGASVLLLSLADRSATVLVLAALTLMSAAAAVVACRGTERVPAAVRAVLTCTSFGWATGLAAAVPAAAGLRAAAAALVVLAVPASAAALGARPGLRSAGVAAPVELTGAGAALVALGLSADRPPVLGLVLAVCGVIAAASAVRPERRRVGSCAAVVLFLAALWVWLAQAGVTAPEAYAVPASVPALVVGVLRRRRDREASSWVAYGPGLATALVPSLAAAPADTHWVRPLLLEVAALAVTLVGGRRGLVAPLVLGGAVLALDGLHELAPYVAQVVGLVPRWVPMALAGALLLAVGATYERRLREARRLRAALGRMR